jgi:hypothetical protein
MDINVIKCSKYIQESTRSGSEIQIDDMIERLLCLTYEVVVSQVPFPWMN